MRKYLIEPVQMLPFSALSFQVSETNVRLSYLAAFAIHRGDRLVLVGPQCAQTNFSLMEMATVDAFERMERSNDDAEKSSIPRKRYTTRSACQLLEYLVA